MNPAFIIDCSMAMALSFLDESSPRTVQIQDRMVEEAAIVPGLWYLEITNVLAVAEGRKRISSNDSDQFLELLSTFDIHVDEEGSHRAFDRILPLCRRHSLTSYDAAYLELALRRQLPLATLDDALGRAATSLGLTVLT